MRCMSEARPGRKRLFLAAVALLALGVTIFFYLDLHGDVRVTFIGASATQPDLVTFSVANTYRRPVVYYFQGETEETPWTKDAWAKSSFQYTNYTGRIDARAAEDVGVRSQKITLRSNFDGGDGKEARWRVVVLYNDSWSMSRLARLKAWLAPYAARVGLQRLSQKLKPTNRFIRVTGPEMLGNRPAPASVTGAPR